MNKQKIFAATNILFSLFFLFMIITTVKPVFSNFDRPFFFALAQFIIFIIAILVNSTLAYFLLRKQFTPKLLKIFIVSTFFPFLWFILIFTGYLFATNLFYLVFTVFICGLLFLLLQKLSKRTAIILTASTFIVTIFGIASGFEENYCIAKGEQAEKQQTSLYVKASKKDAQALKDFNIKPGQQVAVAFRAHMLCHTTFKLSAAIKDAYFSR